MSYRVVHDFWIELVALHAIFTQKFIVDETSDKIDEWLFGTFENHASG